MPSFRNPRSQAHHAVQQLRATGTSRHEHKQDGRIHSLGTLRNREQSLTRVAQWLADNRLGALRDLTPALARAYLSERAQQVGQSQLNADRQALQAHLGERLTLVRSEAERADRLAERGRAYTPEQVALITAHQPPHQALATQIAQAAGLRAHELLTLRPANEQPASTHRDWREDRFQGRDGVRYTVVGKGGLIREVCLPATLAARLEALRLPVPHTVTDRGIRYQQHYALGGGQAWSQSFSAASKQVLGWSAGAHGLRHRYAQARMDELQGRGHRYSDAREIVSQELGHFREDITEVYLR